MLKKDSIAALLKIVREAAPEIEAALGEVKDPHVRAAIAGGVMQHLLAEAGVGRRGLAIVESSGEPGEQRKTSGTQGRILHLRAGGFFGEPRRLEQVLEELRIGGYHHSKSDIRMSLLRLARKKLLRRIPLGAGRQRIFLYAEP